MNKDDSPAHGFDWADAQKRFLDAVAALGTGRDSPNPWQQALEFWWQRALPSVSDSQGVAGKLVRQSQALFGLNEQFGRMLREMAACAPEDDWQALLDTHLNALKKHFTQLSRGTTAPAPAWQEPLDSWAHAFSWLSPLPAGLDGATSVFPEAPSLGGNRRLQEQQRHALQLWQAYLRESQAYQGRLAGVGARAVEVLRERLVAAGDGGACIASLRDLYDLWGDSCERAFARETATEEYAASYGRVVDALIAFKRHSQVMVDEVLRALDLPTRTGMDTMQKRQQEIRRDLRSAAEREQGQARAIADLQRELEDLRRTLGGPGSGGGGDDPA